MAMPMPMVPAHAPIARARSAGSRKMSLMMESPAGMVIEAPAPITPRQTISGSTLPENAAPSEPPPKTTRPATKSRLRP